MDKKTMKRYKKIFNEEEDHLLRFALRLAEEGAVLPNRIRYNTARGSIKILYSKHIDKVDPAWKEISSETGVSIAALKKAAKSIEEEARRYLTLIDQKISSYNSLFDLAMREISLLTDWNIVSVKDFLKLTKSICSYFKSELESEVDRYFSRYFYLTGFTAESGRNAASGMSLHVTPSVKSMCVILRVKRGDLGGSKTNA